MRPALPVGPALRLQHSASDLIQLDRLEQRTEVAFAESFIALALDDLEKDRADDGRRENLQQHFVLGRRAVEKNAVALQARNILLVSRQSRRQQVVVGGRRLLEGDLRGAQLLDRRVDVFGAESDVLNAFTVVRDQVFLDLALVVRAFVDRNANLAARTRHRLALEPRELALDVEITDFAEVEQAFVESRPFVHAAAVHVMRQVVDRSQTRAAWMLIDAGERHEVDVVDRHAAALRSRVTVDEVDQRIADALYRRNVEFHRAGPRFHAPRTLLDRPPIRERRIFHAKSHGADRRPVHPREALRKTVGFGIDDEVDAALPVEQHILRAMLRDRSKT